MQVGTNEAPHADDWYTILGDDGQDKTVPLLGCATMVECLSTYVSWLFAPRITRVYKNGEQLFSLPAFENSNTREVSWV